MKRGAFYAVMLWTLAIPLRPGLAAIEIRLENPGANQELSGIGLISGFAFSSCGGPMSARLRVNPGKPEDSYLLQKVEQETPAIGGQMPLGGPPLAQEQIDTLREWILAGAPPPS